MALLEGMLAGYGIAIPVGAIAILIIDMALRRGFLAGFMAGAGAATADFLYAAIAVLAGFALLSYLAPYSTFLQALSSAVLIGLGCYGLVRIWHQRIHSRAKPIKSNVRSPLGIYTRFLGLTLLNPLTIVYFGALILGRDLQTDWSAVDSVAFILGAGLASLSWQTFLAAFGAATRSFLSEKMRDYVSVVGNLIIIGFGISIILQI